MSVISQVNVQNMTIQKSDLPSMTISFKGDITAHVSTTTTTTTTVNSLSGYISVASFTYIFIKCVCSAQKNKRDTESPVSVLTLFGLHGCQAELQHVLCFWPISVTYYVMYYSQEFIRDK